MYERKHVLVPPKSSTKNPPFSKPTVRRLASLLARALALARSRIRSFSIRSRHSISRPRADIGRTFDNPISFHDFDSTVSGFTSTLATDNLATIVYLRLLLRSDLFNTRANYTLL